MTDLKLARKDSRDALDERIRIWWDELAVGQAGPHPILGAQVVIALEGDEIRMTGKVDSQAELDSLIEGAGRLAERNHLKVKSEVELVEAEAHIEVGLLTQPVVGVFESDELAARAAGFLEAHPTVAGRTVRVVESGDADTAEMRELLGDYHAQLSKMMSGGHALVIAVVDENDAFKVREMLDEDTVSVETLTLPPRLSNHGS